MAEMSRLLTVNTWKTSLSERTPPSRLLTAAFGDKRGLFSRAVKRYMGSRAQYATKALDEPTLEKVVRALFESTVAFSHHARPTADLYDAGGIGRLRCRRFTGERYHDRDMKAE